MKQPTIPAPETIAISLLRSDPGNPNLMKEAQITALQKSIETYGFIVPVITNKDLLIADGHQRVEAAKRAGLQEVSVIRLPLQEVDRLILQQVLNKLRGEHQEALDAKVYEILYKEGQLEALATLLATKENRLVGLMQRHADYNDKDLDHIPPTTKVTVKEGDLYQLGRHRLLCGDSTKQENYERLMQGEKADAVFTDPPYGVSYTGTNNPNGKDWGEMAGDDLRGDELQTFLQRMYEQLHKHTKKTAALYSCYASSTHTQFETALNNAGWKVKQQLIWDKGHILGRSDYHWAHEPIMYCSKQDNNNEWWGDRTQKTIIETNTTELGRMKKEELISLIERIQEQSTWWKIKKDPSNKYIHATQKPVALPTKAIKNSTRPGATILEPFAGSGSTIIACETTGRTCRAIELSTTYCQAIINRYETLTGNKAEKIE